MKSAIIFSTLLLSAPFTASADSPETQDWSGSGEAGLSIASGNTKSQNVNAKLDIKYNDERWKDDFYLTLQRNKSNTTVVAIDTSASTPSLVSRSSYDLTANRYEAGASVGYKFDERSYLVGALRYEHDTFSPYDYQYIFSVGYGYQVLKDAINEFSSEIGPGYKVVQATSFYALLAGPPPVLVKIKPDSDSNLVARGKLEFKHNFNDATSFVDTFVIEAGSGNAFMQNDAGIQVKMSTRLALNAGYQIRHNSDVLPGFKKNDQLLTTNLVYSF